MREKHIIPNKIIYDMFKELSNMSRVDQYQINWTEPTTKAMVDFFQQLKDMNQDQGKQIEKLISQIKIITKLLLSNSTKEPLQEEEKKEKAATTKKI